MSWRQKEHFDVLKRNGSTILVRIFNGQHISAEFHDSEIVRPQKADDAWGIVAGSKPIDVHRRPAYSWDKVPVAPPVHVTPEVLHIMLTAGRRPDEQSP